MNFGPERGAYSRGSAQWRWGLKRAFTVVHTTLSKGFHSDVEE